ncbi:MAG: Methyltransferase type 11 [Acidimicrobiales bacterium]|nr:Methyltransferase type 11 [Acidimicrobiales bacterium]
MAGTGIRRSVELLEAFRREQVDPDATYARLAADSVELLSRYTSLDQRVALDVGGGPGYTAAALRAAGAHAFTVDPSADELRLHGRQPEGALVGDGRALPVRTGSVDVCCSFNTLEHVRAPWAFLDELVRITRSGGVVFVCVTNWLSPWGGHETSPWHYLGGERAASRYARRTGLPPKNRYGESLFEIGVGEVLQWAERHPGVALRDAFPRYYPSWCRPLVRLPGVREVATWNLALVLDRH